MSITVGCTLRSGPSTPSSAFENQPVRADKEGIGDIKPPTGNLVESLDVTHCLITARGAVGVDKTHRGTVPVARKALDLGYPPSLSSRGSSSPLLSGN